MVCLSTGTSAAIDGSLRSGCVIRCYSTLRGGDLHLPMHGVDVATLALGPALAEGSSGKCAGLR
jgi:hypothetical protein